MPSFTSSNTMSIPGLAQRVSISGSVRSDIFCTSVSYGEGTAGSTASLAVPSALWDEGKKLVGKTVIVSVGYGSASRTAFCGTLARKVSSLPGHQVEIEAWSKMMLADAVYLGQELSFHARYPRRARLNGVLTETGWNLKSILRDVFSSSASSWRGGGGSLPSDWRSKLKLGSLSVLDREWNRFPLDDMEFPNTTLRDFFDSILAQLGTVTFREEFRSDGSARLEWFEMGDPGAKRKTIRVARAGESAAGTNVASISHDEGISEVRNRVVILGDEERNVVSISTATSPALRKLWNSALESAVLANPEATKAGGEASGDETRGEWSPGREHVFRRYGLPTALFGKVIDPRNALTLSDGRDVEIQVYWWPMVKTESGGTWTGTPASEPVLLEGVEFDWKNLTFTLRDPAIDIQSAALGACNKSVITMVERPVGITLTYRGDRLIYDSGVDGDGAEDLDSSGLSVAYDNRSFGFVRLGNSSWPSCRVYVEGTGWVTYNQATTQDDRVLLRRYGRAARRERNQADAAYSFQVPYWTDAYRLGDRILVVGQDGFDYGTHQIRAITVGLTHDHGVSLSTSNQAPLTANEVIGS
jgi:hypothetical protein